MSAEFASTVDYGLTHRLCLEMLGLIRYENEDVALNTGHILKEMLRHESIARILLYSDQ